LLRSEKKNFDKRLPVYGEKRRHAREEDKKKNEICFHTQKSSLGEREELNGSQ